MATEDHDFVTVDLRSYGAQIRQRARERGLSVSNVLRAIVSEQLAHSPVCQTSEFSSHIDSVREEVRLNVRIAREVARALDAAAKNAAVSRGVYLEGLVRGSPPPAVAVGHEEALIALGESTDQLALLMSDLALLLRHLRSGKAPAAEVYKDRIERLPGDLQRHLDVAARLIAILRPALAFSHRTSEQSRIGIGEVA